MKNAIHRIRLAAALAAVLCALVVVAPVLAQTPEAGPAAFLFDGDLWTWDGQGRPLEQHTEWGRFEGLTVSPEGTRLAFTAYSNEFRDWLQTVQGAGGFTPPENIWLFDLPLRQTRLLAGQPDDAAYNGPSEPGTYTIRQALTWSPDGRQLAWLDILITPESFGSVEHTNTVNLNVYDLAARTTRVLDSFPVTGTGPDAGVDLFRMGWGQLGIALNMRLPGTHPVWSYRIYDMSGEVVSEFVSDDLNVNRWITYDGQHYLFDSTGDRWLDWRTGAEFARPGPLELYSLTAPDGAYFALHDDGWTLHLPGQPAVALGDQVRPYGISRDGEAALFRRQEIDPATGFFADTLVVQTGAGSTDLGRYSNAEAVWGPVDWRVGAD